MIVGFAVVDAFCLHRLPHSSIWVAHLTEVRLPPLTYSPLVNAVTKMRGESLSLMFTFKTRLS